MKTDTRPTLRFALPVAALALGAGVLVGCQSDNDDVSEVTETVDAGLNAGKLGEVPAETRQLILDDLDGMTIEGAELLATDSGPLYRVRYYEDGTVKSKVYNREGLAQALPGDRPNDTTSEPIEQEASDGAARDVGSVTPERTDPANGNTTGGDPTSGGLERPVGGGGDIPD